MEQREEEHAVRMLAKSEAADHFLQENNARLYRWNRAPNQDRETQKSAVKTPRFLNGTKGRL